MIQLAISFMRRAILQMERRCFAGFTTSFSGNRFHARGLCDATSRAYVRGFEVKASAVEVGWCAVCHDASRALGRVWRRDARPHRLGDVQIGLATENQPSSLPWLTAPTAPRSTGANDFYQGFPACPLDIKPLRQKIRRRVRAETAPSLAGWRLPDPFPGSGRLARENRARTDL